MPYTLLEDEKKQAEQLAIELNESYIATFASNPNIEFHYYATIAESKCATKIFSLSQKTIFDSYGQEKGLAEDIKKWPIRVVPESMGLAAPEMLSLYNYTRDGSRGTVEEWLNNGQKAFIAYEKGGPDPIGFVFFEEKFIDGRSSVYIAQAGVKSRGRGLGEKLMRCVMTHYPAGTLFDIGTRLFNTPANRLYKDKLGFEQLDAASVKKYMSLDERYVGFSHIITEEERDSMLSLFLDKPQPVVSEPIRLKWR